MLDSLVLSGCSELDLFIIVTDLLTVGIGSRSGDFLVSRVSDIT